MLKQLYSWLILHTTVHLADSICKQEWEHLYIYGSFALVHICDLIIDVNLQARNFTKYVYIFEKFCRRNFHEIWVFIQQLNTAQIQHFSYDTPKSIFVTWLVYICVLCYGSHYHHTCMSWVIITSRVWVDSTWLVNYTNICVWQLVGRYHCTAFHKPLIFTAIVYKQLL